MGREAKRLKDKSPALQLNENLFKDQADVRKSGMETRYAWGISCKCIGWAQGGFRARRAHVWKGTVPEVPGTPLAASIRELLLIYFFEKPMSSPLIKLCREVNSHAGGRRVKKRGLHLAKIDLPYLKPGITPLGAKAIITTGAIHSRK